MHSLKIEWINQSVPRSMPVIGVSHRSLSLCLCVCVRVRACVCVPRNLITTVLVCDLIACSGDAGMYITHCVNRTTTMAWFFLSQCLELLHHHETHHAFLCWLTMKDIVFAKDRGDVIQLSSAQQFGFQHKWHKNFSTVKDTHLLSFQLSAFVV